MELGIDVNLCDVDGNSPLHVASVGGRVHSVEELLKHGADVDRAVRLISLLGFIHQVLVKSLYMSSFAVHVQGRTREGGGDSCCPDPQV